jgi:hypothetical protein
MRAGGPIRLFERLTALAPGFRGECDARPSGRCAVSAGTGHFHGDPVPDMPRLNVGLDQGLYGSDFSISAPRPGVAGLGYPTGPKRSVTPSARRFSKEVLHATRRAAGSNVN